MKQEERNGMGTPIRRRVGVGRTIGTFALGAAAGSAIALLFAPASGCVTRRRLGLKVRALQRESVRRIGQAQRMLSRKADNLRQATTAKLNDAREWVVDHVANGQHQRPARRRALHHA